jgi:hypothetical protein
MISAKDAAGGLLGLVLGLACLGCLGSGFSHLELPELAAPPKPSVPGRDAVAPPAAPELRIPGLPLPPAPAPAAEPLPLTPPVPQDLPPPPPVSTAVSKVSAQPESPTTPRLLQRAAAERYAAMDSYIIRFRRREQLHGRNKPEELVLMKVRKHPWSVYFKWLGAEGKGREVVYVKGRYGDKIHTLLAAGDVPLMPAGKRMALAPDNPLVRASSRHTITEAGFGSLLDRLGATLDALEQGDYRAGSVNYVGSKKRPEFELACESLEQEIPPGREPHLPRGGRRLWFFDSVGKLPALIITKDETGREVEYYCYDRLQYPVKLDDDDFDPDKLWGR